MSSRVVLMGVFFDQFLAFLNEMSQMYPDDPDFPLFVTTIKMMRTGNPSMVVKYVNENVSKFEDKIKARDESFFLNYSYSEELGDSGGLDVISKLKGYVSTMSAESKEAVWKYIDIVSTLAKKLG